MRRIFAMSVILFTLLVATPSPADVVVRGLKVDRGGYRLSVTFITEEEADSLLGDTPEGLKAMVQRSMIAAQIRDSLNVPDVMLVMMIVNVDTSSVSGLDFRKSHEYGLKRAGRQIRSLGLLRELNVAPGEEASTFVVFRRMPILKTDTFYIIRHSR